ncbi:MAG: RNase P modulator RnpM [Armatimonadota bacterium]
MYRLPAVAPRTGKQMRRSPQRSCIGCRTVREKRDLVRVALTPEGKLALDPSGKLPGRGAYLCPDPACLTSALKRKSFDRAFRQAVPRDAVAELETRFHEYEHTRKAREGVPAEQPGDGSAATVEAES